MQLVIIGDGEERERLTHQSRTLFPSAAHARVDESVRFVGWLPQEKCARQLAAVDCLVMSSMHDCGGAVVLEAMAMAKPVIATAWGGPFDYLDESCGILFEPHDQATLVRASLRQWFESLIHRPSECQWVEQGDAGSRRTTIGM